MSTLCNSQYVISQEVFITEEFVCSGLLVKDKLDFFQFYELPEEGMTVYSKYNKVITGTNLSCRWSTTINET